MEKSESEQRGAQTASAGGAVTWVTLRPRESPGLRFAVVLVATVFWNVMVWSILWRAWQGHGSLEEDGTLPAMLVLVPFAALGLVMAGVTVQHFLALFNPRPHVTLSREGLVVGETAELAWRFDGDVQDVERLQWWLVGAEVRVERRGKTRRVNRQEFVKLALAEVTRRTDVAAGKVEFRVPADARPTREHGQPEVHWQIRLQAHIPRHPDVVLEYRVRVVERS